MMDESEVEIGWMKVPTNTKLSFVGQDTVCMGKGCNLIFYNFINDVEHIYCANNWEKGDGIKCYSGHKQIPILAFAEQLINPRIIILKYPDLTKLKILPDGAPEGYMTMTFSDFDYLITLSDIPEYELVIWDWRTGEKLYSVATKQTKPNQILCCSIHFPVSVVQYYEKTSNFKIWEICNSYKCCVAFRHKMLIPNENKMINCIWNSDGFLFVLDLIGHVYMMNPSFELEIIIHNEIIFGNEIPCFTWFKNGILILHPNLDITHYKKFDNWQQNFSITPARIREFLPSSGKDSLIAWSYQGELMELDLNKHCFLIRKKYETIADTFCFIYPSCNHFASLHPNNYNMIKIWDCLTGNEVNHFKFEKFISTISSNPVYPYLAIGFTSGTLTLLNCYDSKIIKVLTNFYLHRREINKIVFSEKGDIIATANLHEGLFFIIRGHPGEAMKIIHFIHYRQSVLDICVNENEKYINLYILVEENPHLEMSQRIVLRSISKTTNRMRKKRYISDKYKFTNFFVTNNYFIAKIFGSSSICSLNFNHKTINVMSEINTGHCLKHFMLDFDVYHIYTCGYDGLIIIRSKDLNRIIATVLPHHRYNGGVGKVIVDPYLRFVISYGTKTNELVCSKFVDKLSNIDFTKYINEKMDQMKNMFFGTTTGYEPKGEMDKDGKPCITYFDIKQRDKLKAEEIKFTKERQTILKEFLILKEEVINLLDENLNGPQEEKIDILEFYLHSFLRKHKEEINKNECEWIQKYNKELIIAQNNVWHTIKKNCHDNMETPGSIIKEFFSNFFVDNYPFTFCEASLQNYTKMIEMYRELENMAREGDLFQPWVPADLSVIEQNLQIQPILKTGEIKENLQSLENYTTIQDFILPNHFLFNQFEIHTCIQIFHQLKLIESSHRTLQITFNKKYDVVKQQKERDMDTVLQKNKTLKHIISELNWNNIEIVEPKWYFSEYCDRIFTVEDYEIGFTPYISPSDQEILDSQAAEAEKFQLLLLADDFPDKALYKMMEGALEIHWKDTLKKDIPKPECMLYKEEENYNDEDIHAIQEYEKNVAYLNNERQKYREMLEIDFNETVIKIQEIIKNFDRTTLKELALYKIDVEKARLQDCLLLHRLQYNVFVREDLTEQREIITNNIKSNNKQIIWIQNTITELYNASTECKNVFESLTTKDKLIEKNFKRDFQDYSMLVQEQSHKLFKKQPKTNLKEFSIVSLINELSNSCVTQEKNPLFDQDYLDYLKAIDILDQHVGVPNTIDEVMYKIICKHRRLRFENDLKIQANLIEQSEIDITIQTFQKYLQTNKELGAKLMKCWEVQRESELECVHDKQIQFITKASLIEITQTGCISDFDNAILVHKKDVEKVNNTILKTGNRKVRILTEKMKFRRLLIKKEWEHKKMKMKIEDLKEHLHLINNIKVTQNVKKILECNNLQDKTFLTYDQEVESQKRIFEKIIKDRQSAIQELDNQIKSYKKRNTTIDKQIVEMKIDLNDKQSLYDIDFEKQNIKDINSRMTRIAKRNKLAKQIQEQHNEILVLQTELELLKLKTYPTLKFKI